MIYFGLFSGIKMRSGGGRARFFFRTSRRTFSSKFWKIIRTSCESVTVIFVNMKPDLREKNACEVQKNSGKLKISHAAASLKILNREESCGV